MKILIIVLMFFCFTKIALAQNAKIDTLNRLISMATTDTGKIKLMINKLNVYSRTNLDTAIIFGKEVLEEAHKINYYQGEIDIRQTMAANYCFKGDYKAAKAYLEFLEQFIKPSKDSSNLADVYANFGMMYGMESKYDSSIYFYEIAIGIKERGTDKKSLATSYSNIAISYQQRSNYSRALFYLQNALKIAEENKNETSQTYTYQNMGNTYADMGDSVRAEQSYLRAIELAKKVYLPNVELYAYSNLASIYIKEKKWQKAYDFAMKAATLGGAMGDQGIQAASMSKAAVALASSNRPEEALALAKKSIAIADSSAQPLNIFQANSSMASTLKLVGNYKEAITYFEKSLSSLKGSDIYTADNGDLYKELAECYEKTGKYAEALKAVKMSAEISDSARSRDNIRKATELTMNYEFDKKQQILQAELKSKEAVAKTKQLALLVGLGLTLILAVVAFIGFKNKQKANSLLTKQKEEIQSTLTKLKSTQSQLIQSEKMASLGELTAGIAHEIQNPLNFVNNFSEVSGELLEEMETELVNGNKEDALAMADDVKRNLEKILHHGKRADAIVKGMLQHSRVSTGTKELTDINALTDEYLRLTYHGARAKDNSFHAVIKTELDENIGKINILPQDIGRVFLNLFANAFYSVGEKKKQQGEGYQPIVTVSTKKEGDHVEIKIGDNGNGIPQKVLDKIFQPFFTTKPTGQGTGLGLSLSYDIITNEHGGTIKAETKEGEGAVFIIGLPYT